MYGKLTTAMMTPVWALALVLVQANADTQRETPLVVADFNLPSQPLSDSLRAIATETQTSLLFDTNAMGGRQAPALRVRATVDEAIARLLEGSGLKVRRLDEKTIVLAPVEVQEKTREPTADAAGAESSVDGAQDAPLSRLLFAQVAEGSSSTSDSVNPTSTGQIATLEEVVVTAQKREERLIDVPLSVTVLSGKELKDNRTKGIEDLALAVPGVSFRGVQPGASFIVIRGLGTQRGNSALTGLYLDEIPMTESSSPSTNPNISIFDQKRVEVLKGPQGTLFGEGSMGGTIRYVTNDPVLDRIEGAADATYFFTHDGSPSSDFNAVLNVPVVNDVFGIRVAAGYENFGGWIDKVQAPGGPILQKDINDSRAHNVRAKALWRPSDDLNLSAMIVSQRSDYDAPNHANVDALEQSHFQAAYDDSLDDSVETELDVYNLTVNYDFGFASLLSSTSRIEQGNTANFSQVFTGKPFYAAFVGAPVTSSPVPIEIRVDGGRGETSSFAQELRLTSADTGRFKWLFGGFYKSADRESTPSSLRLRILGQSAFNFDRAGSPLIGEADVYAGYGDVGFKITDRLQIGGGLRYAHEKRTTSAIPAAPSDPVVNTYDKLTYRAYMDYKLADRITLYLNTSTGFRAGGANDPAFVALGAPPSFKPEEITSYEVGVKGGFLDGRLTASAALFTSDWSDVQGNRIQLRTDGSVLSYTSNAGEARIKGGEVALNFQGTDRWSMGVNADVTHSRYVKIDTTNPNPPVLVGDWTDFTPEYSFSLYSDVSFNWSSEARGLLHVDYNQQGISHFTLRNEVPDQEIGKSPVVGFVNLRLDTMWRDWTLSLFSRNLLDETKTPVADLSGLNGQLRRRTIGVTVSTRF